MTINKTITAQDIASKVNAMGYRHYGERAKGWEGNGFSRIYFGRDFVTVEDGQAHGNRAGKARAQTIGYDAVEAVQKAIDEIAAR